MKTLLLATLILAAFPAWAQREVIQAPDLPNKPEPTIRVKLIDESTKQKITATLPVPHRTADRDWWLLTLASEAATVADVENTKLCLELPNNYETNPVYGSHPSRLRLYGISEAIWGVDTYLSWKLKRSEDAAAAFGARRTWPRWWLLPLSNIAGHTVGVLATIGNTGR